MKAFFFAPCLLILSAAALAEPSCHADKASWMPQADFKKGLEAQGYQIKTFKVNKGQCYEIYGLDQTGKKVEIYFDPATAAVVHAK